MWLSRKESIILGGETFLFIVLVVIARQLYAQWPEHWQIKPGVRALILVTAVFSLSLLRLSTANVSYFQLRQYVLKHAVNES